MEKLSKTKWREKSGEGRWKRRGGETRHRGGDITHSQLHGIQKVKCHPAIWVRACGAPAQCGGGGSRRGSRKGEGRCGRVRSGAAEARSACVQAPGPEPCPRPCNDFIFSEERPPEPRLPRAWSSPVRCAGGRTRTRPRSPRIAAASRTKGLAPGEGLRIAPPRSPAAAGEGARGGLSSCAPPSPIPEKGKAGVPGRFCNSEGGCRRWPGRMEQPCPSPDPPGTPAPLSPVPGLRPAAQCASPVAWPWPSGPCANPATRVGDGGGRWGPAAAPVAARHSFRVPCPLRRLLPGPRRDACTFHRLLHHLIVAIHGGWGPCPARGRAAASRPSGCSRRLSERWG